MPPASGRPELAILQCDDGAAWERWLDEHHADSPGVWLKFAKKGAGVTTVTFAQALEVALCFGWIDGQLRRLDDRFYTHRFTPRAARSRWSEINVAHAEALIDAGRMRPTGMAQVQVARSDGRWEAAYEPQSRATVAPDLQAALDAEPAARAFFATLTGARRYAFLHRLHQVTDPERRARRIASYIELLRQGRTLN
ncbi:MAG: YdeI/OmpD-associated family protein [Solirubrobacteraceae bacterium]